VVVAPQRQQVHHLQKDGLAAQTLSQLLMNKQLPRNPVVLVDEAGQIGGRQLRELIRLVQAHDGRLILSGDTRHHGAVAASDALHAIEEHGGLKPAEIRQIRRQNPGLGRSAAEQRFIRSYRSAVKAAAAGRVSSVVGHSSARGLCLDDRRLLPRLADHRRDRQRQDAWRRERDALGRLQKLPDVGWRVRR
jgi:hypothetical protein